jgi:flagellar protein FlgJ
MADITALKSQIIDKAIVQKRVREVENSESSAAKDQKLKKACADFESILLYYMFKGMRQTVPKSGFLKQSPGKDAYNMILDQKVAEEMANRESGSGLKQTLFEQLQNRRVK